MIEISSVLADLKELVTVLDDKTDITLRCQAADIKSTLSYFKKQGFNMLLDITVVDYADADFDISGGERFDVVYHLRNLTDYQLVRIKAAVTELKPEINSVSDLWHSANFLEREAWDMYGVNFTGHPDLRRILMYPEFVGHPLRKDYPVQGKQPRVQLIAPEVENTARLMNRADLIAINPRNRA